MKIVVTPHAKERRNSRNVSFAQINEALTKGKVQRNEHGHFVRAFVSGGKRCPLHVGFAAKPDATHGVLITVTTVFWKEA
jgi:Domain of unknown function (DUF4258)